MSLKARKGLYVLRFSGLDAFADKVGRCPHSGTALRSRRMYNHSVTVNRHSTATLNLC